MKKVRFGGAINARRKSALSRLTTQLQSGVKEDKQPLTEGDIVRIQKEIDTLSQRIVR